MPFRAGVPERVKDLYRECARISLQTPPYKYGGGHNKYLYQIRAGEGLDCSSSTSLALYRAGLFGTRRWSLSSGDFKVYGLPGKGRWFTVWAKGNPLGHVYIQFHGVAEKERFDTSPWGWGTRGPRLREGNRRSTGFTPRHYKGL